MSLTMLSVVIVLSGSGVGLLVRDGGGRLLDAARASCRPTRKGMRTARRRTKTLDSSNCRRASSAPCCGRYGDSSPRRHRGRPCQRSIERSLRRVRCRSLPTCRCPRRVPQRSGPAPRFSTPSATVPTARSLTPSGRPQLSLACQAPRAADLGQQVRYRLVVRNTGDGVAQQVVVEPHMVAGADSRNRVPRWFPVGDLAPGASREIILRTVARRAESLQVRFFASDRNGSEAEAGGASRGATRPPWKSPLPVPTRSPWGTRPCSRSVRGTRAPLPRSR